jgi:hypothetical protein
VSRIIIPSPRIAAPARHVMPAGLTGVGSMQFDGLDDYATGVGLAPGTSPITIRTWVKVLALPVGWCGFMVVGDPGVGAHVLGMYTSVGVTAWRAGSAADGWASLDHALAPGFCRWRRFGLIRRAGVGPVELWLDGVKRAQSAAMNPNITNAGLRLGTMYTVTQWAKCRMWDARVSYRALSAEEMLADFRGTMVDTANPVARWPLEVISGGKTPEIIGGTMDTVTGAIIDPDTPFKPRLAAPARIAA